MSNFFTDNKDLQFALDNLDFQEVVSLKEADYKFAVENVEFDISIKLSTIEIPKVSLVA